MSTALTTIFGNEIKVTAQPRIAVKQYAGFPGAHGLTGMHLGTRGYPVIIRGTLAESGESYSAARASLQSTIDDIETYLWAAAATYTFMGCTYSNVVFDKFQLVPDSRGVSIHWTSEGYATCQFIMYARSLL